MEEDYKQLEDIFTDSIDILNEKMKVGRIHKQRTRRMYIIAGIICLLLGAYIGVEANWERMQDILSKPDTIEFAVPGDAQ